MLPLPIFVLVVLALAIYVRRDEIFEAIDRSDAHPPNTSQLTPVDEQEFYNEQAKREWNQIPQLN
jgi:hypothetical protein